MMRLLAYPVAALSTNDIVAPANHWKIFSPWRRGELAEALRALAASGPFGFSSYRTAAPSSTSTTTNVALSFACTTVGTGVAPLRAIGPLAQRYGSCLTN